MVFSSLPKTREEARQQGSVCYFTGVVCKNGHIERRYTNTGICYGCKQAQMNRDRQEHGERVNASLRETYRKHQKKRLASSKQWAEKNRDKSNAIKTAYKKRNREEYLAYCREYDKRRRESPMLRLSKNTSKGIWDSLKSQKGGRHWEGVVGFTLEQLVEHLQAKFTPEMNWDNYCKFWEVDHVKPVNLCTSFEEAWQLSNLQPLECSKNRSKRDRYVG